MDNFDGIDPEAFFAEQKRLYGEEHRDRLDYEDFVKAAGTVLATQAGRDMISGLQKIIQYGSSKFRKEDDYNTHAAAARDGAAAAVTEILVASRLSQKKPTL